MKLKMENMDMLTVDIGSRDITILRYNDGLLITNIETGKAKEIKFGDLGETLVSP